MRKIFSKGDSPKAKPREQMPGTQHFSAVCSAPKPSVSLHQQRKPASFSAPDALLWLLNLWKLRIKYFIYPKTKAVHGPCSGYLYQQMACKHYRDISVWILGGGSQSRTCESPSDLFNRSPLRPCTWELPHCLRMSSSFRRRVSPLG